MATLDGLDVDSQASGGDTDSAVGSFDSSTQSLRASLYEDVEENGRKYHRYKQGSESTQTLSRSLSADRMKAYFLPNDEIEQDRLDLQHHLFVMTLDGKLHLAPIQDLDGGVRNVLDIGTGTGIWAIDFASAFPSANVLGTDLSPMQPEYVPANCRFEIDDAEDPWMYSEKFDYIHGRALVSCFRDHMNVWRSAFDALNPGGWIELQDVQFPAKYFDDSGEGTALELWMEKFMAGGVACGRDFTKVQRYKQALEEVGFVDVVEKQFVWPLGTWARGRRLKMLGAWVREDSLGGLHGASMALMTRGLGMNTEEVEMLLVEVRKELRSNRVHSYLPVCVVYGRKP